MVPVTRDARAVTHVRKTRRNEPRDVRTLLPLQDLTPEGLLTRPDGTHVRYLELVPGNPLVLDELGCERMTRGFTEIITRLPAGQSIQGYVEATPVPLDDLLARAREETDTATNHHEAETKDALRRLAELHERSIRVHAEHQAAVDVRYVLITTTSPQPKKHPRAKPDPPERLERESRQQAERIRSALAGLDISARLLDGDAIAQLLHHRFAPSETKGDAPRVHEETGDIRAAIATAPIDLRPRRHLKIGEDLERTIYLSRTPERTFYGWLLHAMQSPLPWTLSVHIKARDRATERERFNRRARRLWGVNEGAADRRARPDRTQHDQEAELERLVDELSSGAETLCDVSVYHSIRATNEQELDEATDEARADLGTPVDGPTATGDAMQYDLWTSTLPLGLDAAKRTVPMISRNAADTVPFVSTSSGSPTGIPFAFADPGRTLERLNPFDRMHDNGTTLIFAKSGGGKTMTTIALMSAALPRGCQVNVFDRSAGHYRFLCDLIPGAAHVELGAEDGATINPWDTPDPNAVPRSKVAFLVRLHALLIGDHDASEDSYGLGPLERNLLAVAIRRTYERTSPGESALHATLLELAATEDAEAAAVYRNLAHRLSEFCGDGTYGYLFDRPTTVHAEHAPLVVFNTRRVPDDVAAPLLFAVLEFVSARVERRYERHLTSLADGRTPAGPFDGTSAVVVEELWKLVERRATGAWVNELVKRARHIGLWFVAITQQRSDLAGPQGRALLDNSTIQLFLRNGPDDVAHIAEALSLSSEEVAQINRLTTEKGSHAQAYLINGERGRGAITIRLGSEIYWLATSDPINDVPERERALREVALDGATAEDASSAAAFAALDALADR